MPTPTENWQGDHIELAAKMWAKGMSCKEIAIILGDSYTRSMVASKARKLRDLFPTRVVQIQPDLPALADMWNNTTKSSVEIGRKFRLNAERVRDIASKNPDMFMKRQSGAKRRPAKKPTKTVPTGWISTEPVNYIEYKEPGLDAYELSRLPGISMADNNGCKWPLTDTGPHKFCGCEKLELKPYCPYHVRKALGFGTISERRAIKDARKIA